MAICAIIPTYRRPQLVVRAVWSVLNQTLLPNEVIVVVDGLDQETIDALHAIQHERLRIVVPQQNLGQAGARNFGVAQSKSEWIAFLDDDDEWLPNKLEVQLQTAQNCGLKYPIVACRLIARTSRADLIWPRRLPRIGESLCDYMCTRSLPLAGEGLVQSSMVFTSREMLERVAFQPEMKVYDDSDWLLRADREPGVGVVFPKTLEPLAIWHIEQDRWRVSTSNDWKLCLEWTRSHRQYLSKRAYAGIICKSVSALAAASGDPGLFPSLLSEARRYGQPSWVDWVSHCMNFTLTPAARDRMWSIIKWLRP